MNVPDLLRLLRERRIVISADGERLRYRCPPGAITADVRDAICAHRAELLAALSSQAAKVTADGNGAVRLLAGEDILTDLYSRRPASKAVAHTPPSSRLPANQPSPPVQDRLSSGRGTSGEAFTHFAPIRPASPTDRNPSALQVSEDGVSKGSKGALVLELARRLSFPRLALRPTRGVVEAGRVAWETWTATARGADLDTARRRLIRGVIAQTFRRFATVEDVPVDAMRMLLGMDLAPPAQVFERAVWTTRLAFTWPCGVGSPSLPPGCARLPPSSLVSLFREVRLSDMSRALAEATAIWDPALAASLRTSADALDQWMDKMSNTIGGTQ